MTTLSIDIYDALKGIGVDDGKARTVADSVTAEIAGQNEKLAAQLKTESAEVAELKSKVARLESDRKHLSTRGDIADLRTEVKTDIADLRADFGRMEIRLVKWFVGSVVAIIAVNISFVALVLSIGG